MPGMSTLIPLNLDPASIQPSARVETSGTDIFNNPGDWAVGRASGLVSPHRPI